MPYADTLENMLGRLYWRVSSLLPFHRCHIHAEDEEYLRPYPACELERECDIYRDEAEVMD